MIRVGPGLMPLWARGWAFGTDRNMAMHRTPFVMVSLMAGVGVHMHIRHRCRIHLQREAHE